MSMSWVRRSVRIWIPRTPGILRGRADRGADTARARRVPRARRPLHRRPRRGVLPPLRGPEGDARPRADLRALPGADRARARPGDRARRPGRAGGARARALALRVRGLHG